MKNLRNKFKNVLFRLLMSLITLLVMVYVVNYLIFMISVPKDFQDAKWLGYWKSEGLIMLNGKMIANLPKDLISGREFEVDVIVYYNIWGFYRMGSIEEFKMIASISESNVTSGQGLTDSNNVTKAPAVKTFNAKIFGVLGQEITYSGSSNQEMNSINGSYQSKFPYDLGSFKIEMKL